MSEQAFCNQLIMKVYSPLITNPLIYAFDARATLSRVNEIPKTMCDMMLCTRTLV